MNEPRKNIIFFCPRIFGFDIWENGRARVLYMSLVFHSYMSELSKNAKNLYNQNESAEGKALTIRKEAYEVFHNKYALFKNEQREDKSLKSILKICWLATT